MKAIIIGASGAIGDAVTKNLTKRNGIEKIYTFSRAKTSFNNNIIIESNIDFFDEETIINAANSINDEVDLIFIASGILHDNEMQPEKSLKDLSADNFKKNFIINTIGPALIAKYFAGKMKKDQKSVFAAISARVGSISDNEIGGWYSYRASKAALNMIIKNLAIEHSRTSNQKIFITLQPGTVISKLSDPFTKNYNKDKLFTPDFSAKCLLEVIDMVQKRDSGKFFDWNKQEIQY